MAFFAEHSCRNHDNPVLPPVPALKLVELSAVVRQVNSAQNHPNEAGRLYQRLIGVNSADFSAGASTSAENDAVS